MNATEFPESALVLVGHGSTQNKDSCQALLSQAEALRRRRLFREVVVGFWKEPPFIAEALGSVTCPRVFVLPFFISAGYFSEEAIPEALGFKTPESGGVTRVVRHDRQLRIYCRPVGTHEHMTNVILSRAERVLRDHPFPRVPADGDVTLFIAGHGTERNEESRKSVERQVTIIREQGRFAAVHAVFMEEEPRISDCLKLARTQSVVVVPFFLSDGLHVREDIPVLLGESEKVVRERLTNGRGTWRNPTERQGKRIWYADAVGTDPVLEEVILERVREAALWPDLPASDRP